MVDHTKEMFRIAIVLGSTRPGRRACCVGEWVLREASPRQGVTFDIVDLVDQGLSLFDQSPPATQDSYSHPGGQAWAARMAAYDSFIFVVPEYNRSIPAALKNALDFLHLECSDKAAGIVSYGYEAGGARAADHLRQVLTELEVAHVRHNVLLFIKTDFIADRCVPQPHQAEVLHRMLDQLIRWGRTLKPLRTPQGNGAAVYGSTSQ
jgi:NAD(P)H-dependent FMN reductase